MCLSIPSKVVEIDKEKNSVIVDTMGVKREARLDLMAEDSVKINDYVLLHIGFVMSKINQKDALISIKTYEEILMLMDEDERRAKVLEDDEPPSRDKPA
jgi:hydrogenase expression/formation protein HypC